jgi:SAM-dependent methyltransferase
MSLYDALGIAYAETRRPDPRIAKRIERALGGAHTVVNVGAGAGSYEPRGRVVLAIEPSLTMIAQRPAGAAPAIRATAESLPLFSNVAEATLAVLTVHHWGDPVRGLEEMRRVARKRVVILTWDQPVFEEFWLVQDYFPGIACIDRTRALPVSEILAVLGECEVTPVPIPYDCRDGFLGAFWRRPEGYLDPRIRSGISAFAPLSKEVIEEGLIRLETDLRSGVWRRRYRHLLALSELDLGYRLLVRDAHAA